MSITCSPNVTSPAASSAASSESKGSVGNSKSNKAGGVGEAGGLLELSRELQAQQKAATIDQMLVNNQQALSKKDAEIATKNAKTFENVNGA